MAEVNKLERRARELCPELKRILEQELQAGNSVVAVKDDSGFVVVLRDPFDPNLVVKSKDLVFRDVNNRSEWKLEIHSKSHNHTLACGFGGDWKPPSKLIRNSALITLVLLVILSRMLTDCFTRRAGGC